MFVSYFVRSATRMVLWVVIAGPLTVSSWAQESTPPSTPATSQGDQASAPQTQSAPPQGSTMPSEKTPMPPLTPLPQAPAPQRNAGHLYSGDQNYARPLSGFPNFVAPYTVRHVPQANLGNSAMTDQLFHDGQIFLSINDAVAMALENNLDITLQRYNLSVADTDLLLTATGQSARGVATGVVQGTQGGSLGAVSAGGTGSASTGASGTGAGGTQVGVGGAGAGAAGIVVSTLGFGPTIDNFDPSLTGNVQGERTLTPQSSTIFYGVPTLNTNTNTYNFSYNQGFSTGTLMTVGFNNSYQSINSLFALVNPTLSSSFRFTLRQHLLQGFGFDPNLRWIRIARNNREIADVVFRQQIMTTVSQVENIYWDLVTAYEAVKVNQRQLELANKTLSDDQEQVKIGTMAPITLVQAQSGVESAKQNLIMAQTSLQLEQLLMKNAITKNTSDPILAAAPVIPTDTLQPNEQYEVRPVDELIQEALQGRPEIATARIQLTNYEITRKSLRNALLPSLDVYAFYGANPIAGPQNPTVPTCPQVNRFGECYEPGLVPTNYGGAFSNLYNSTAPDKGIGVNLNIPIRNRAAQANQVRSELEYRQQQVALQQTENTITLQVRQAQFGLQNNYAALQAAIAARDYAQQNLDAEQKKFHYGASTPTLVLQASSNLTQAESNVLNSAANYEKAKVLLDFYTAETLTKLGISIADAEAGQVKHAPTVPGVVPADVQNILRSPSPAPQNPQTPPPSEPNPQAPPQSTPPQNPAPQS
ncbi:MAG TPA: TolC family protein [Terriglobales bacterium]|nr:TolC family protein [Terriglobales bacterium]